MTNFEKRTKLLKNERILIESYEDALAVGRKLDSLKETAINNTRELIGTINNLDEFYFNIKDSMCCLRMLENQKSVTTKQWLQRFPDYQPVMGDKVWVSTISCETARRNRLEKIFIKSNVCVRGGDEDNYLGGQPFDVVFWECTAGACEPWPKKEVISFEIDGRKFTVDVEEAKKINVLKEVEK